MTTRAMKTTVKPRTNSSGPEHEARPAPALEGDVGQAR